MSTTSWGGGDNDRSHKRFKFALLLSIVLHGLVLLIHTGSPGDRAQKAARGDGAETRITARLKPETADQPAVITPPAPAILPAPKRQPLKHQPNKPGRPKVMSVPAELTRQRTWSIAESDEMNQFLDELKTPPPAPPKPPSKGAELSRQALASAREEGRRLAQQGDVSGVESSLDNKTVEPFSLQMYFDAFVRKLNQSSAFVKNDPRARGSRKALVQIVLKPDGTLKSYRVIRAADQQVQIAYIKQVIDLASPFSAFPQDIRRAMESFSVLICIYPPREGEGGGFTRSFGSHDCD
ncbi:MAG: hypothetical protein IV084_06855 [Rugosibacter sp.]|nr:hypothetical protein [Rugosibacter sp.]